MKEKIVELENRNLIVFVDPARLLEIAESLIHQQERDDDYRKGVLANKHIEVIERDFIHCELNDGPISIWFRLPHHNPALDNTEGLSKVPGATK